jgi:hypothetical protein
MSIEKGVHENNTGNITLRLSDGITRLSPVFSERLHWQGRLDEMGWKYSENTHDLQAVYEEYHQRLAEARQGGSVFIDKNRQPQCTLLILGNFDNTHPKKELYLKSLNLGEPGEEKRSPQSVLGKRKGVNFIIWDLSCYEKNNAPAKYREATVIVIIPSSAEDLRLCFDSVYNQDHKPAANSAVIYLNLFETASRDYVALEEMANELLFSHHKLNNSQAPTAERLVEIAIEHTGSVYNNLLCGHTPIVVNNDADPQDLSEDSESYCYSNSSVSCCVL